MHSTEPPGDDFRLMRGKFSLCWEQIKGRLRDIGLDMIEVHDVFGELIVFLRHFAVN